MPESTFNSAPAAPSHGSAATNATRPGAARALLRWIGRVAVALFVLLAVGAASIYGLSERRFRGRFAVPEHRIAVAENAGAIARGEHIATVRGCVDCHGAGFSGNTIIDQPSAQMTVTKVRW